MKIEREVVKPVFVPVVLTLESQGEVDYIYSLMAATNGVTDEAFGNSPDHSFEAYKALQPHASVDMPYLEVSILEGQRLTKF